MVQLLLERHRNQFYARMRENPKIYRYIVVPFSSVERKYVQFSGYLCVQYEIHVDQEIQIAVTQLHSSIYICGCFSQLANFRCAQEGSRQPETTANIYTTGVTANFPTDTGFP